MQSFAADGVREGQGKGVQRLPIDQKLYEWTGRREYCKNEENVR